MARLVDNFLVFGDTDDNTIEQMRMCMRTGNVVKGALMADSHLGYQMPIGGVVAYDGQVSPSGVGFDIACGIKAINTRLHWSQIEGRRDEIADAIQSRIIFGLGGTNPNAPDHELFDDPAWSEVREISHLKEGARNQLGTVGSGNHFVDVLTDSTDEVWVVAHFGSRGFGHKTASGFMNLAIGREFNDGVPHFDMVSPPILMDVATDLGRGYIQAMNLAGRYAYAGRDYVVAEACKALGMGFDYDDIDQMREIHNHHNFAWLEEHDGQDLWVVRKGATPAFDGQWGFVGGSMADDCALVCGVDTQESAEALFSTVHGSGRIMSRSAARGRWKRGVQTREGLVTPDMMNESLDEAEVTLRGGGLDESPHVYRKLREVLAHHEHTLDEVFWLRPRIVVMAGADTRR